MAVAADPADLVTLDTAYAWLRIPTGSDDIALSMAITATSERMASWCGRALAPTACVETYDGNGNGRLVLRNYPIIGIASLTVDGRPVGAVAGPGGPGYRHDTRRTVDLVGDVFTRGPQNVEIAYTAGYTKIPADLAMACLDWLRLGYAMRDRDDPDPTLIGIRAGDTEKRFAPGAGAVTTDAGAIPMPPSVYAVLNRYKNTVPA